MTDSSVDLGSADPGEGSSAIDPDWTLGRLVTERPSAARVLERHGLDYCCGGARTLSEAAAEQGVDLAGLAEELGRLEPEPEPDWARMSPSELARHVVEVHHRYLRSELPRLSSLAEKVAGVHGALHPELHELRRAFERLRADLLPHLVKEERMLFPAIEELEGADDHVPWFPFGSPSGPISVLLAEHDTAGELLERMRELSDDYRVPEGGCASYRALFHGREELERDLHLHVHKENNVLFPAVARLERRLSAGTPTPG